jgi:hypothetical protein
MTDSIRLADLGLLESRLVGAEAGTVLPVVRCRTISRVAFPLAHPCPAPARCAFPAHLRTRAENLLLTRSPNDAMRSDPLPPPRAQDRDSIDQSFGSREGFPQVQKEPQSILDDAAPSSASSFTNGESSGRRRRKGTPKKKEQRRTPSAEKKSRKRARAAPAPVPAAKVGAAEEAKLRSSPFEKHARASSASTAASVSTQRNSIRGYFGGAAESPDLNTSAATGGAISALPGPTPRGRMFGRSGEAASVPGVPAMGGMCAADADSMRLELGAARKQLANANTRADNAVKQGVFLRKQLEILQENAHSHATEMEASMRKRVKGAADAMVKVLRVATEKEMVDVRRAINAEQFRLGRIARVRAGHGSMETWIDGQALRDVALMEEQLRARRERVDQKRKEIRTITRKARADAKKASEGEGGSGSAADDSAGGASLMDADTLQNLEAEETVKMQQQACKREEIAVAEKKRVLESEKRVYLRQLKRVRDEDGECAPRSRAGCLRCLPLLYSCTVFLLVCRHQSLCSFLLFVHFFCLFISSVAHSVSVSLAPPPLSSARTRAQRRDSKTTLF